MKHTTKTYKGTPYIVSFDPTSYTPLTEDGVERAEISFDGLEFCTTNETEHLIDNAGSPQQNLGFIAEKSRRRGIGVENQQVLKAILSCLVETSWEYTKPFAGMHTVKDVLSFYGFSEEHSNMFPESTLLKLLDATILLCDAGVTSLSTKDH
jgi:hypothetical protein